MDTATQDSASWHAVTGNRKCEEQDDRDALVVLSAVVTMETPVPGLVSVRRDVTADVDDVIRGDRWVNENC